MKFSERIDRVKRLAAALCEYYRQARDRAKAKWLEFDQRSKIGAAVTAAWLLFFFVVALLHILVAALTSAEIMALNEWGDYLAGVFAPVAFFWLVLGYYQQGEELRQNTEALRLQQREMEASATATAQLAAITTAEHEFQKELIELQNRIEFQAKPDWSRMDYSEDPAELLGGSARPRGRSIVIQCFGALPRHLQVTSPRRAIMLDNVREGTYRIEALASTLQGPGIDSPEGQVIRPDFPIDLEITYYNSLNQKKRVLARWESLFHIEFGGEDEDYALE